MQLKYYWGSFHLALSTPLTTKHNFALICMRKIFILIMATGRWLEHMLNNNGRMKAFFVQTKIHTKSGYMARPTASELIIAEQFEHAASVLYHDSILQKLIRNVDSCE